MKVQSKRSHVTDEIRQAVMAQLENPVYYKGEQNLRFEQELAAMAGVDCGLTFNAGSSALLASMAALGIGPGDEAIIPANGYLASAEAVVFFGGVPVFCDVDEETATMTAETVAARITPKTRVIIPVHMYGHPVDMDPLLELAREHGLKVVEVCAHAAGARYKGKPAGSLGDVATLSFGGKNIWVGGTGGALVTDSEAIWREADMFSNHGWPRKPVDTSRFASNPFPESASAGRYERDKDSYRPGLNLLMAEIQASVGRINLRHLEANNTRRREAAVLYTRLINEASIPVVPLAVRPWAEPAFLHYVVRAQDRDEALRSLNEQGIEATVHYETPLPELTYYRQAFPTDPELYPRARRLCGEILGLPIHQWITDEEVHFVVERLAAFYGQ